MTEEKTLHYHIATATFQDVGGEMVYVSEREPQTSVNYLKSRIFANDYIHALASAYNAVTDENIHPVCVTRAVDNPQNGETVFEMSLTFPHGRVEKVKVVACNGELGDDPMVVIIIDDDMNDLLDSLGIGTEVPSNGVYH